MSRTGIRQVTSVTRKIEKAIGEFNGAYFTASQITEKTGLERSVVQRILSYIVRRGTIEIVTDETVYRHDGRKISKQLPVAFVAEKVWAVLKTAERPLSARETVIGVETLAGDRNLNLRGSTSSLLTVWFRVGVLERTGRGGAYDPFKYSVRTGIAERPVATNR